MPQVIWKFSASMACARTVGDSLPLASSAIERGDEADERCRRSGRQGPGLLVAVGVADRAGGTVLAGLLVAAAVLTRLLVTAGLLVPTGLLVAGRGCW